MGVGTVTVVVASVVSMPSVNKDKNIDLCMNKK